MGATGGEIVLDFPLLELVDVCAVIRYFLKNTDDVEGYL